MELQYSRHDRGAQAFPARENEARFDYTGLARALSPIPHVHVCDIMLLPECSLGAPDLPLQLSASRRPGARIGQIEFPRRQRADAKGATIT